MENRRSAVFEAQGNLRKAARLHQELKQIVPDGIFGSETEEAVRAFQNFTGLPETGKIDQSTWDSLVRKGRESDEHFADPIRIAPISKEDLPLEEGDTGNFFLTAQQMLLHLAKRFSNIPALAQDGVFGPEMTEAVKEWQRVCRFPASGKIDKPTWNRLAQFYTMKL